MGKVVEFPRVVHSHASKPLWRHVLGEVLRGERLEQERILTEVAATAGVSPQYLSEIERGRKEPSSEILGSVTEALGLELVDVVGRVAGRLGEAHEQSAREERGRRERAMPAATGSSAAPRHPLDLTGRDLVDRTGSDDAVILTGFSAPGGPSAASPGQVFLLAA